MVRAPKRSKVSSCAGFGHWRLLISAQPAHEGTNFSLTFLETFMCCRLRSAGSIAGENVDPADYRVPYEMQLIGIGEFVFPAYLDATIKAGMKA